MLQVMLARLNRAKMPWILLQLQNYVVLLDWLIWKAKKYKLAARKFLETGPELGNNYTVIAPQDVATYGSLCALASFDRAELKSKVIDNINFRNFLELVPEIRELINDFYNRVLHARIDSHNKILYARHADQRNGTFQRVLQTGSEFDREVRAMLLRANLIKHDYNLKASRKH
ncbi:UNVERIFIED_CONTAM: COP9 signalosome complex subunit [Sesamum calycinum]|uniref:COP9 signalosome complex subunit n=1 Tax=Sesamum calycinum TaxID=2727403 RepID=A0AAW2SZJ8_9LAMI